jgi:hypothetical protein
MHGSLIGIGAIWLFLQDLPSPGAVTSIQFVKDYPGPESYHHKHILRATEFLP